MGKPKAPKAPDPFKTAQSQAQANKETALYEAQLNRFNSYGPTGSVTWSRDPRDPTRWTQRTVLSRGQQQLLDADTNYALNQRYAAENALARLSATAGRLRHYPNAGELNYNNAPAMPISDTATYNNVADAVYRQAASRLAPRFAQVESDLQSRLAAQGITQGSQAYDREMSNFSRDRNDAYNSAINSSILNADSVLQNQFSRGMASRQQGVNEANYLHDAAYRDHAQNFNEQLGTRQQNISELAMLLNPGAANIQIPGVNQRVGAQVGQTPVADSIYNSYNGQMNAYGQQMSGLSGTMGTLGSIAGAALLAF